MRESNHSAQALYLPRGFRPVGQRAAYYRNPQARTRWCSASRFVSPREQVTGGVALVGGTSSEPHLYPGPQRGPIVSILEVHVSRSLNKVILIGNLGADPEVRSTSNGSRVATLSLATSRRWKNQAGEQQEKTEWHRVILWNNKGSTLADLAEKY